ncbi:Gfo/Idh/MocA family protein [Cohnella rhizosphaerae]|uniref:Gfo/Idh/MocA family oxidoreductase n=1 Tax=Cohnella rhizosphaerae TaxID=1457232 RepID=A0A9X4KNF6_9BACL|nr:Gfo/Idh/MocA family oxidoreductase [Cohnella rhizosphaerae]MDG0808144.1 Gfo/Idh/MocA family oxidoreductase [Cohnella rhizosphaerae]
MQASSANVRIGVIGLGQRGKSLFALLREMDGVEVAAVSDLYEDRLRQAAADAQSASHPVPALYQNYKELLAREDIEAVIVASSWTSHAEIAIAAMRAGKYVGSEVGGAASIEECWELVRTSEATGVPCMLLENCCYGRSEMAVLNMVRQGLFGELIHCRGGYLHDLREEVATGIENRHYRIHNYLNRNGDLYPTHGLGLPAACLNINRGNRIVSVASIASKARGINAWASENLGPEHRAARSPIELGDIVTTMMKCAHGETILLTHDTSLPRPYSRAGQVQGTKGVWMEDGNAIYIDGASPAHEWEPFDSYLERYEHPVWRRFFEGRRQGRPRRDGLFGAARFPGFREVADESADRRLRYGHLDGCHGAVRAIGSRRRRAGRFSRFYERQMDRALRIDAGFDVRYLRAAKPSRDWPTGGLFVRLFLLFDDGDDDPVGARGPGSGPAVRERKIEAQLRLVLRG